MFRVFVTIFVFLVLCIPQTFAAELTINGQTAKVPVCGGLAGIPCDANEWCDYPSQIPCGFPDQFGVCRPKPFICLQAIIDVCGCDGTTYNNSCEAAKAGYDVAHDGPCRK